MSGQLIPSPSLSHYPALLTPYCTTGFQEAPVETKCVEPTNHPVQRVLSSSEWTIIKLEPSADIGEISESGVLSLLWVSSADWLCLNDYVDGLMTMSGSCFVTDKHSSCGCCKWRRGRVNFPVTVPLCSRAPIQLERELIIFQRELSCTGTNRQWTCESYYLFCGRAKKLVCARQHLQACFLCRMTKCVTLR